jgi:hypothetical protein
VFSEQKIGEGIYFSKVANTEKLNSNSNIKIQLHSTNEKKNTVIQTEYKEKFLAKIRGEIISIYENYENDFYRSKVCSMLMRKC